MEIEVSLIPAILYRLRIYGINNETGVDYTIYNSFGPNINNKSKLIISLEHFAVIVFICLEIHFSFLTVFLEFNPYVLYSKLDIGFHFQLIQIHLGG